MWEGNRVCGHALGPDNPIGDWSDGSGIPRANPLFFPPPRGGEGTLVVQGFDEAFMSWGSGLRRVLDSIFVRSLRLSAVVAWSGTECVGGGI